MTLIVRTDRSLIRAMHSSSRFLRVEVIAPPAPADHVRPSASLAFVIDRSGSMYGTKIELAKQAVREAIGRLAANDRFAVVSYDDRIDVLAESTEATPDARRAALSPPTSHCATISNRPPSRNIRGCPRSRRGSRNNRRYSTRS